MTVDEAGALWLSDPWVVLVTLLGALALIVWCHRWLEAGAAPLPRQMATRVRGRAARSGRARRRATAHPSVATIAGFGRAARPARPPRAARLPRTAA
jgi:hypothetical protein